MERLLFTASAASAAFLLLLCDVNCLHLRSSSGPIVPWQQLDNNVVVLTTSRKVSKDVDLDPCKAGRRSLFSRE